MINPELYNRTVGILVDAYFNDTLRHGSCHACAVGNLIAANMGISFSNKFYWVGGTPEWAAFHMVDKYTKRQKPCKIYNAERGLSQIMSTGYLPEETAKIEWAFEMAPKLESDEDWMFNGLMAVIDVLDEIHQNTDAQTTQQSKNKFHKQLKPSLQ